MTVPTNQTLIRHHLKAILHDEPGTIRADVAAFILEREDYDPIELLTDTLRYGCAAGTVGHLTYYADTHAWFDRHYDEIDALRCAAEDTLGEPLRIKGDLKNALAWFAFKETVRIIACDDLGLDL